ncbi:MAG: response regulator [Microcoleaceae cyanobacterium]
MKLSSTQGLLHPGAIEIPHILIVDDHVDCLQLLVCMLEMTGCSYATASCASEALCLVQDQTFDLALVDIVLPDLSGIDLLNQIKQQRRQSRMIAIAVTALAFTRDQEMIRHAGFHDYLCKPYLLKDLERMLRNHLNGELLPTSNSICF